MGNFTIRKAEIADMKAVEDAHRRSIREICINDYTQEQVDKWSAVKYSEDRWENTVNNNCCYVIELDGTIEGVCHAAVYSDGIGEIVGLYLAPAVIGKGLGRKVFEKSIDYIKEKNASKVIIKGTKTAKGFYESMGFKLIEEKMFNIRGIDIETFCMELEL